MAKKFTLQTRQLNLLAMLFAWSIVLSMVESWIPLPLPVPVHYGLANIAVIFALLSLGTRSALVLTVLKSFGVFIFRGPIAGLLSFVGSLLAVCLMALLDLLMRRKSSLILMSVAGAWGHNIGQVLAFSFLYPDLADKIILLLPLLLLVACGTGILTGLIYAYLSPYLDRFFKFYKKKNFLILLVVINLLALSACQTNAAGEKTAATEGVGWSTKQTKTFYDYFDTVTVMTGRGVSKSDFDRACSQLEALLGHYHQLFHAYQPFAGVNNIYTINRAGGRELEIEADLYDLLTFGQAMGEQTGGLVDISMGRVLDLWHTARQGQGELPPPGLEQLRTAQARSGLEKIDLSNRDGKYYVRLLDSEMTLDTGAIAKGYALERISQTLAAAGFQNLVLSIGGDVRTIGSISYSDEAFQVAVQNPVQRLAQIEECRDIFQVDQGLAQYPDDYLAVYPLKDGAVVTSGLYERYFVYNGVLYNHIIDPATLAPANRYLSVTVTGPDAGVCDALATALCNCSPDKLEQLQVSFEDYRFLLMDRNYELVKLGEEK